MFQFYVHSGKRFNLGFSVIEALVSIGLLSIVSMLIIPGFVSHLKVVNTVSKGDSCSVYLNNSFSKLEAQRIDPNWPHAFVQPKINDLNFANGANIDFFFKIPDPGVQPKIAARFKRFGIANLLALGGPTSIGPDPVMNNGVILYTPLLANDLMGYLGDLYSTGYNDVKPLDSLPELTPPDQFVSGTIFKGDIQVKLYKLNPSDNTFDLANPGPWVWARPKNQYGRDTVYYGNNPQSLVMAKFPNEITDKIGYEVTIRGQTTDSNGAFIGDCQGTRKYSYPIDFHTTMDFVADMNLIKTTRSSSPPFPSPDKNADRTTEMSNKAEIYSSVSDNLKPIFTNISVSGTNKERNECSQDGSGSINNFYMRLRIKNLQKESGLIPLCLDSSIQWLKYEKSSITNQAGWCIENNKTKKSDVYINYDWRPLERGWVPCENLGFCGQAPNTTTTLHGSDYVEYQYQYYIPNDNNASGNRLWGCEFRYLVALADPSGNLLYVPSKAPDPIDANPVVLNQTIRESLPKIYFKPPPCYTCSCKPCKKGSGGFLGGLFSLLVLFVLIVASGGAFAFIGQGIIAYTITSITVVCALGGLGCNDGSGGITPGSLSNPGTGYTACQDYNDGCKCGQKCNIRKPPAPDWYDSMSGNFDPSKINENGCTPNPAFMATADGYSFKVVLAYSNGPGQYSSDKIPDGETIAAQTFLPEYGRMCFAEMICKNGSFSYIIDNGKEMKGCYPVKVGHTIQWTTPNPNYSKSPEGEPLCLEVQLDHEPYGFTEFQLMGFNQLDTECARLDTNNPTNPPLITPNTNPPNVERVVGNARAGQCASAVDYLGNQQPFALAHGPNPLMDTDSYGVSTFRCWEQCEPPAFSPRGNVNGITKGQQLYYEQYNTNYQNLPFCTMDRSRFTQ